MVQATRSYMAHSAFGGWTTARVGVVVSAQADATPEFGALPGGRSVPATAPLISEELLRRAQAGDEEAFAEIFRAVQPRLLRYLRVVSRDELEDVAAETWVHVCRDLATFSGDGSAFLGWLLRIARNRAIDHARYRNRRPATPVPVEQLAPIGGPDDTAGQALDRIATDDAVALIAGLPTEQAEAVMLRAVLGLDAKTAGHVLGRRPGAVRTAAHRGLKTLADRLGDRE